MKTVLMSEPFTTTLQSLHHKENLLVRHIMLNAYVRLDVANLWLLYCISLFTTKCCLHYLTVSIFQHVAHPRAQLCRWWYRYNNSVCLSVQPSVTLRYCVKKRLNILHRSKFFHPMAGHHSSFLQAKRHYKFYPNHS